MIKVRHLLAGQRSETTLRGLPRIIASGPIKAGIQTENSLGRSHPAFPRQCGARTAGIRGCTGLWECRRRHYPNGDPPRIGLGDRSRGSHVYHHHDDPRRCHFHLLYRRCLFCPILLGHFYEWVTALIPNLWSHDRPQGRGIAVVYLPSESGVLSLYDRRLYDVLLRPIRELSVGVVMRQSLTLLLTLVLTVFLWLGVETGAIAGPLGDSIAAYP